MKKTSVAEPYPASELMQTFLLNRYGKNKGSFQMQLNIVFSHRKHTVRSLNLL